MLSAALNLALLQSPADIAIPIRSILRRNVNTEVLMATLPELREQAAKAVSSGRQTDAMLPGASDSLAAAALQQKLDELATAAGVQISSQEILPAQAAGEFRAIAVRVTTTAPWRSLVALLGASPGASTAAFIAISVLEKCFPDKLTRDGWLPKLKEIIPSYGISLIEDADFCRRIRADTAAILKIENV